MKPLVPIPPSIPAPLAGQSFLDWLACWAPDLAAIHVAPHTEEEAAQWRLGQAAALFEAFRIAAEHGNENVLKVMHAAAVALMRRRREVIMNSLALRLVGKGDGLAAADVERVLADREDEIEDEGECDGGCRCGVRGFVDGITTACDILGADPNRVFNVLDEDVEDDAS